MVTMTELNIINTTTTTPAPNVNALHCWCGATLSDSRAKESSTLGANITTNITEQMQTAASRSPGSLFMNNWVVILLISGTVLAFIAGLFIKRQQVIKDRQRREEQYLAYFHSILPHSRLYGKIETPDEGSRNSSNRNSKSKSKSKESNKYSTQHGLIEVWENIGNFEMSNEEIRNMHSKELEIGKNKCSKHETNKVLEKIDEASEASQSIENEMSSGLSTTKLEIEIVHESEMDREQRKPKIDKSETCEMTVLKDLSEAVTDKDRGIEMNSKFTTTSDLQDSLCVIWI